MFALVKAHEEASRRSHGIGLLKKDFLAYTRSAPEIALSRR